MKFTLCNSSQPVVDEKKVVCVSMCTCDVHIHITVIFSLLNQIALQPKNPDLCKACKTFTEYIKPVVLDQTTLVRSSLCMKLLVVSCMYTIYSLHHSLSQYLLSDENRDCSS